MKHASTGWIRAAVVLAALASLGDHPSGELTTEFLEPAPADWHDRIRAPRLRTTVEELTGARPLVGGEFVSSRNIHHPDHPSVVGHLQAELEAALGDRGEVWVETFDAEGETGLANIVGELPPESFRGGDDIDFEAIDPRPVVVAAHFDSIATLDPSGTWDAAIDPAPGADDDASGVAVVLELARELSDWEPGFAHPVRFVLFDAEEYGLIGSRHHVDEMEERSEEAAVALVLDPVGYDPGDSNVLWFLYDERWPELAEDTEAQVGPARSPLVVRGINASLLGEQGRRSDHVPFWDAGSPALHFGSFPQPPTYHTMGDDLSVVDFDFLTEVTAFVAAVAAVEAGVRDDVEAIQSDGCSISSARPPALSSALLLFPLLALRRRRERNST